MIFRDEELLLFFWLNAQHAVTNSPISVRAFSTGQVTYELFINFPSRHLPCSTTVRRAFGFVRSHFLFQVPSRCGLLWAHSMSLALLIVLDKMG
jgi:hypothetical protein